MEILPSTSTASETNGFWFKKQGILGWAIVAAIGYGVFNIWGSIVAWIIPILQNTIEACILGGVLLGLFMFLANPRVRASIAFLFQHFCTWITSFVTDVYPLEVIRNYIKKLEESADEINKAMIKLSGATALLKRTIDANIKEIKQEQELAQEAQRQGKDAQLALHSNAAIYLLDSNAEYAPIYQNQITLYQTLEKVYNAALFKIQDKTKYTDQLEMRWKTSKASMGAITSAKKIFKGSIEADMANEALKKMEETMANEAGAFTNFMRDINGTLETIDLKNGAMTSRGKEMLAELNAKVNSSDFNFLLNKDKSANSPQVIMVPNKGGSSNKGDLANLI